MSYTLYLTPSTASMAVHWMLIELGVPFEVVSLDFARNEHKTPEYLKLNPLGRVPTLVIDGTPYTESTAQLMILAERHPQAGLAPAPDDPQRAKWLETMVWIANNLQPALRDWFYADKDGPPTGASAVRDLARRRIHAAWPHIAGLLADGRPYLFGERPGCVDFLAAMVMRWSRNMPQPANDDPVLAAFLARMGELPSYQELCRREDLVPWP